MLFDPSCSLFFTLFVLLVFPPFHIEFFLFPLITILTVCYFSHPPGSAESWFPPPVSGCNWRQSERADCPQQGHPERDCRHDGGKKKKNSNPSPVVVPPVFCIICPFFSRAVDRHCSDLPVAEGWDEGDAERSEEVYGRPGPLLQGRHPEASPGKDHRGDSEQPQPAAAHHGDGDGRLVKGQNCCTVYSSMFVRGLVCKMNLDLWLASW